MKKNTGVLLLLSLIAMVAVFLWMRQQGAPLNTPATPKGILDLEFAWNKEKVEIITGVWGGEIINVARNNIYIDFLFIFAYTSFLTLGCKWLAAKHKGKWALAGNKIARIVPAAGTFDIAENALMLLSLQAVPNNYTAIITTTFAVFKFALVAVAVLYLLAAIPILARKR
jgi:hypothetical protein